MASLMPGGQRAFVSKKSRATAADVRLHVRSGAVVHPCARIDGGEEGRTDDRLLLSEVVEAVDVEEVLSQRKTSAVYEIASANSTTGGQTPRALAEFPADDVEVRNVEREWGTAEAPVDIRSVPVEAHAHSVLSSLSTPLSLVHHKCGHLASGEALTRVLRERETIVSPHIYEGQREGRLVRSASVVDRDREAASKRTSYISCASTGTAASSEGTDGRLQLSLPDHALPGVVDRVAVSKMEEENEARRMAGRSATTVGLLFPKNESELLEVRPPPPFPEERSGHRLFVRIIRIICRLGPRALGTVDPMVLLETFCSMIGDDPKKWKDHYAKLRAELATEPLFGSIALFDIRKGKRLTESFHFDANPDSLKALLPLGDGQPSLPDAFTRCSQAAFALSSPLADVVMFIKLSKVLSGCDPGEAFDAYSSNGRDERNRDKAATAAAQFCSRLGAYRMPLAIMFVDLLRVLAGPANSLERSESGMAASTLSGAPSEFAPLAGDDSSSIISADRISVSTTSTFKRIGSGTSASTVMNKVRTPLARRKASTAVGEESPESAALRAPPHVSLPTLQPVTLALSSFMRFESDRLTDEEIVKTATELRRNPAKLKPRPFPVEIGLKIWGDNADETEHRLNSEGRVVGGGDRLETATKSSEESDGYTQEICELPQPGQYSVNLSYRNSLLLCPRSVNMSARSGTARNICVKIQLMDANERPQRVFFDAATRKPTANCARTGVIYHNKTPLFSDEIKLSLPADLNDGHHLLFSFSHVSCRAKERDEPVEYPLGHTWLPLLRENRLASGEFSLPIALEKLPQSYGYLTPDGAALPNTKWLDGHRPAFSIGLTPISSVHPQDDCVESFLSAFASLSTSKPASETTLHTAIQNICKARPERMISFLYQILDALLALIANPPYSRAVSSACFTSLGQLAKICTRLVDAPGDDALGRGVLLPTYVHYFKIASKESRPRSAACRELAKEGVQLASPETERVIGLIEDMERSRNVKTGAIEPVTPNTNKNLHEELADLWVSSTGATREMAFLNSAFLLEIMSKAMAEFLSMTGRLFLPRKSRFSERFLQSLAALSETLVEEVFSHSASPSGQRMATALAASWAFFLREGLSLLDRSFAIRLVGRFNRELITRINSADPSDAALSTPLALLKLSFLRIVSSHEHFIVLNLPGVAGSSSVALGSPSPSTLPSPAHVSFSIATPTLLPPPSPGSSSISSRDSGSGGSLSSELTNEYRSRHFLLGLILSDVAAILETSANQSVRSSALSLLCSLMAAHEGDARLADANARSRVASLYTPVLGIALDSVSLMSEGERRKGGGDGSGGGRLSARYRDDDSHASMDPAIAMAIAGMGEEGGVLGEGGGGGAASPSITSRLPPLTPEQTRMLLLALVWLLRHLERSSIRAWMRDLAPNRFVALLEVLTLACTVFENKTQDIPFESSTDMDDTLTADTTESGGAGGTLLRRREGVRWREAVLREDCGGNQLESLASAEVALTVLDTLEIASQVVSAQGSDHLQFVQPMVFRVLMHLLSCRQSVHVLECAFASQRTFVVRFPEVVFEQESEQCGELCLQLLRHCASRLPAVRSHAAASAYLLMRESFESSSSLARVKMQFTMSLSTLVSNGTRHWGWLNEDCLRRSLRTLLNYAATEAAAATAQPMQNFCEQVKDLVFNMHMILSDTVAMKEHASDFEMSMDLIYRIAKGYQNNPDLRVTWLLNMAARASERDCYAEAAQCALHAAALVAEYLAMLPCTSHLPKGAVAFTDLSDNILEESAVSDDVISPETEGICESRHFSEGGLVQLCERAFHLLERAQQYEMMPSLFQILCPLLSSWHDYRNLSALHLRLGEALASPSRRNRKLNPVQILCPLLSSWHDYRNLSALHLRLGEALGRIEGGPPAVKEDTADAWLSPLRSADKRCFGTFFRVAFFGSHFGDIDDHEFVYKEAPFTKLSEISSRLESFYTERFGRGVVEVIKDSNHVTKDSLDASRAFLQITYVEPFFEAWEKKRRRTHFERSHNLSRFAYATPFTKDGRAHGELREQYKRRTILTVHNSFPYVKTRLKVVHRDVKVLSPIEVAIEDVSKKTRELAAAVAQSPPDAKMLQMVLQGCIGTTVNQGPIEVANVFLSSVVTDEAGKPVDRHQNKLRLAFRDFSKKCADALVLNKHLIQADQLAYQSELQKNYVEFTKKMAPMMAKGTRPVSALLKSTLLPGALGPISVV